ncbi:MAG: hypothetical protein L0H70_07355 [Xanthomonadales bacterium]|nr:hypothetical protein [Xanthomonadales bacterium]
MSGAPNTMAMRRHELLADVEQSTIATARELGTDEALAQHLGAAVADMFADMWGGQQITFPKNGYYGLSPRELEIAARFDAGRTIWQLARDYDMSERGMRKLLARVAARREATSTQADLFDTD